MEEAPVKIFLAFLLLFLHQAFTFSVVSTTPSPSDVQKLDDLERNLAEITSTLFKIDQKLDNLQNCTPKSKILLQNCKQIQHGANTTDLYFVQPHSASDSFMVLCDMETRGGGWTVILKRFDGSQDFYLDWENYKLGFGNLGGEFWMGLEHLYQLSGKEINELLIELVDWDMKKVYAHFSHFLLGNEDEGYSIKLLKGYSGDAGDSFSGHAGARFSTRDQDQDQDSGNCASYHHGAWWYKSCMDAHLTGKYAEGNVPTSDKYKIMYWSDFHGNLYGLKEARMMIRPRPSI